MVSNYLVRRTHIYNSKSTVYHQNCPNICIYYRIVQLNYSTFLSRITAAAPTHTAHPHPRKSRDLRFGSGSGSGSGQGKALIGCSCWRQRGLAAANFQGKAAFPPPSPLAIQSNFPGLTSNQVFAFTSCEAHSTTTTMLRTIAPLPARLAGKRVRTYYTDILVWRHALLTGKFLLNADGLSNLRHPP